MKMDVNVVVDKFVADLLDNVHVSEDQQEIRGAICRVLRRLGLAKVQVNSDTDEPEALSLSYTATEKLKYYFEDPDDDDNNDDDSNDDNNNNDDNNDNNDDDEESRRRSRKRKGAKR